MSDTLLITEGLSLFDNKDTAMMNTDYDNDTMLLYKKDKIQRRATISLSDLIPVASAALREKNRLKQKEEVIQDSPLARALTKVRIGVQTHKIKERFLVNEWIRLALSLPVNEAVINNPSRIGSTKRTKEIVGWYEHKYKKTVLTIAEIEKKVQLLRQLKLSFQREEEEAILLQLSLAPPLS